ncbi:MAG: type I-B CRISPR-associated endonuclease Cas1b [Bacteroidia bacterium]
MKKTYYLFNPGRVSRKDNTLKFVAVDAEGREAPAKYLPVEAIEALYIFGSIDTNSALYNFLGRQHIPVHFFDYYEHYTGSFQPKEYLLAGKMQIEQTRAYLQTKRRLHIARGFVDGSSFNILKNMRYYHNRGKQMGELIATIEAYREKIGAVSDIAELMGVEGNCRQVYYQAWERIVDHFPMNGRQIQPPSNEVNALISFGNMMCYSLALDMIYHTQMNPTISFLHEPGVRRFSLALDVAEVFKPILVDRTIFKLLNGRELKEKDFEQKMGGCFLKEGGKKIFIQAFEERLKETIKHRTLGKKVSYKRLVLLECYKLVKYILKIEEEYKPFKIWW